MQSLSFSISLSLSLCLSLYPLYPVSASVSLSPSLSPSLPPLSLSPVCIWGGWECVEKENENPFEPNLL